MGEILNSGIICMVITDFVGVFVSFFKKFVFRVLSEPHPAQGLSHWRWRAVWRAGDRCRPAPKALHPLFIPWSCFPVVHQQFEL